MCRNRSRILIRLNDATSPTFHVTAWPLPAVVSMECEQAFPPYTKLPPVRRPLADLRILAGSQLRLKIKANSRIKSGVAVLTGAETKTPLQIDRKDSDDPERRALDPREECERTLDSTRERAWRRLEELRGLPARDDRGSPAHGEDHLSDSLPSTGHTAGRAAHRVSRRADDFGIARIVLHYTADPSVPAATRSVELDPAGAGDARNRQPAL